MRRGAGHGAVGTRYRCGRLAGQRYWVDWARWRISGRETAADDFGKFTSKEVVTHARGSPSRTLAR